MERTYVVTIERTVVEVAEVEITTTCEHYARDHAEATACHVEEGDWSPHQTSYEAVEVDHA